MLSSHKLQIPKRHRPMSIYISCPKKFNIHKKSWKLKVTIFLQVLMFNISADWPKKTKILYSQTLVPRVVRFFLNSFVKYKIILVARTND